MNRFYHIPIYLIFFVFFLFSLAEMISTDLWLHLKTGEWIINNLNVPREQLFSYAISGQPWIDHSWLFQVIVFLMYKYMGGMNTLIVFRALMLILPLSLAVKAYIRKVPVFWLLLVSAFCFFLICHRSEVRPDLFSMLFLSLYLYLLKICPGRKRLFFLIPIQIVWANMHGYFIIGPLLVCIFFISELIKARVRLPFNWNDTRRIKDGDENKRLILLFILSTAVFICNPYLLKIAAYPVHAVNELFDQSREAYHTIQELAPYSLYNVFFTQAHLALTIVIFIFFLSALISIKRFDIFNLFIFVPFTVLTLLAKRNIGLFGVASAFTILDTLSYKEKILRDNRFGRIMNILGVNACFVMIIIYLYPIHILYKKSYIYGPYNEVKNRFFGIAQEFYPQAAADFIIENKVKGPIFNDFNTGAYLAWKFYPEYRIFIDGRSELYGNAFLKESNDALLDFNKWRLLADKYSFNAVLASQHIADNCYHLIRSLYNDPNWKLVYFDRAFFVFLKNNKCNEELIKKYQIRLEDFKDIATNESLLKAWKLKAEPQNYLLGARFFTIGMDMHDVALRELEKAEIINPELYEVYQLKGYAYFRKGDYNNAYKAFYKSMKLSPNMSQPYINLGSTCGEMGLLDDAMRFYKEALSIDPRSEKIKKYIEIVRKLKSEAKSPAPATK